MPENPMDNIEFSYLYRDGGNYKKFGRVIFSNPERLTSKSVTEELQQSFIRSELFIAGQIRVPEVFLYAGGHFSYDDHCYHEFDSVKATADVAGDIHGRTIGEFLAEVAAQAKRGWREFDPCDSEGSFGWFLASRAS
jgi:hypothetical protein